MTKRMLIDAAHAEETRVAVVDGTRIEELDFEIASRRQLRGNIYLAKVVRVEPSLQAAFVEYGGNRHGFLAFNEIHPDYFQIPQADREALLREAAEPHHDDEPHAEDEEVEGRADDEDDAIERELDRRRQRMLRKYKIQEVIRRRQIMLIQVVKEERGNKGAALTTYLSLAGRYCVLMPNTARGGGISRKITNAADRKRLKSATQSLDVPNGMGLIVRTAGAARTKLEIKRDYEYLLRMWENIRETTLQSIAPALIYAEEDLVKRAVRDMFDKEFDSIQVEGEAGYREARDFMRMIMPSQAKKVVHYKDPTPLFVRHRIEDQIGQIHSPIVPLKSGGYLVINQTEALVAIDVNSGKATRERNIETTAYKTNMEAAAEAARQLRLRDLAGLIVIDFIDMDEGKNNRAVEKEMKDCLKDDRARVQMGKISGFGLMEISRQRRRMGVLEGSTHVCPHCHGAGRIRSVESSALEALRAVEVEAVTGGPGAIILRLPTAVGLYVLNCKRAFLTRLEQSHGLSVTVAFDDALAHAEQEVERTETREGGQPLQLEPPPGPVGVTGEETDGDDLPAEDDGEVVEVEAAASDEVGGEEDERRNGKGRRRRRSGRGRDRDEDRPARGEEDAPVEAEAGEEPTEGEADERPEGETETDAEHRGRRRRRGRRGGRRMREEGEAETGGEVDAYTWNLSTPSAETGAVDVYAWSDPHTPEAPVESSAAVQPPEPQDRAEPEAAGRRPRRSRSGRSAAPARVDAEPATADADAALAGPQTPAEPRADPYVWADEAAAQAAPASKPRRSRGGRGRRKAGEEAPSAPTVGAGAVTDAEDIAPEPITEEIMASSPAEAATSPAVESLVSSALEAEPAAPVAEAEAAAPAAAEAASEPAPAEPAAVEEPAVEPSTPAEAAVTVPAEAPAPVPARAADPAEISAPPAAPRRGWWRRGG